jgi:hypothetical protein
MKNSCNTINLSRVTRAVILLFWFLVVGTCPAAFGAAVSVDVLWGGLFDNSGQPLAGGKVYTYSAGTTSAKSVYTDSAKTTPAANPVILDGYGRSQVYADGSYKFVIKDADDVTLMTIDNLEYVSSQNPSTLSTSALTALGATIGSLTASLGTLTNMTISSATITLGRLISPEIANASMTGTINSPTVTNGTFTDSVITGGTISPATFTLAAGASSIATPTLPTNAANKGYVDAQIASEISSQTASTVITSGLSTTSFSGAAAPAIGSATYVPNSTTTIVNSSAATVTVMLFNNFAFENSNGATASVNITATLRSESGDVIDSNTGTLYTATFDDPPPMVEDFPTLSMGLSGIDTISPGSSKTYGLYLNWSNTDASYGVSAYWQNAAGKGGFKYLVVR